MSVDRSWTTRRLVRLRDELAQQVGLLADFIPGSLHETWSKCGKPTCHCASEGDPGHGPRLLWVRYEGGKTRSKTVPARWAERFRAQVERSEVFVFKIGQINQINAILAERELAGRTPPPATRPAGSVVPALGGEKGGSAARR